MPAQTLLTDAFVLTKRPAADPFETCVLFSAAEGLLTALQRVPRKAASKNAPLDLFDEASLVLESSNQGRTWFVRESRPIARHPEIGRSYEALLEASAFATLIVRNPVLAESRPAVAALLREALAAFASSGRPDIAAFKGLYRFARDEGHPVRQQWLPMLSAADREAATALLTRPLAGQAAAPAEVSRLRRHLAEYLSGHTEMVVAP
jgi:hypothetical protein